MEHRQHLLAHLSVHLLFFPPSTPDLPLFCSLCWKSLWLFYSFPNHFVSNYLVVNVYGHVHFSYHCYKYVIISVLDLLLMPFITTFWRTELYCNATPAISDLRPLQCWLTCIWEDHFHQYSMFLHTYTCMLVALLEGIQWLQKLKAMHVLISHTQQSIRYHANFLKCTFRAKFQPGL